MGKQGKPDLKPSFTEEIMLQLIKRCPEYAEGYKAYCQESYDHNISRFDKGRKERKKTNILAMAEMAYYEIVLEN